jgi:3-phenylpropionate/trans-cinnamate dioxygenase ferredoxin reductase subunit
MRRAVVVGAGLAGLRAAEGLRRHGLDGELTIVGDETHLPYDRPPLSKDLLLGSATPASCLFSCDDLEATWLVGRAATKLEPTRRIVTLDGGDEVPYDALIIATGCRARPWPVQLSLQGVQTLRTLSDAIAIREAAQRCRHVTIIGAGFLGCEVAAALRARGIDVSMIEIASHPMPALGPALADATTRLHAAEGVDLRCGVSVVGLDGRDRVERVRLSDGGRIETDLVLVALGALPNTEWLEGSGLDLRGGVVCDKYCMAVGASGVAAAGDVAAWPHRAAGRVTRVEHWTNAAEMALRAASNLLLPQAERRAHAPVLTFWSDQYDVKIRAAGVVQRATSWSVVRDEPDKKRLVVEGRRDGALVAGVTFNSNGDHLRFRRELSGASL